MKVLKDVCYGKRYDKELLLDVYLPETTEFSVFVFFHGGGFYRGSKSRAENFAEYLTDRGVAVVYAD